MDVKKNNGTQEMQETNDFKEEQKVKDIIETLVKGLKNETSCYQRDRDYAYCLTKEAIFLGKVSNSEIVSGVLIPSNKEKFVKFEGKFIQDVVGNYYTKDSKKRVIGRNVDNVVAEAIENANRALKYSKVETKGDYTASNDDLLPYDPNIFSWIKTDKEIVKSQEGNTDTLLFNSMFYIISLMYIDRVFYRIIARMIHIRDKKSPDSDYAKEWFGDKLEVDLKTNYSEKYEINLDTLFKFYLKKGDIDAEKFLKNNYKEEDKKIFYFIYSILRKFNNRSISFNPLDFKLRKGDLIITGDKLDKEINDFFYFKSYIKGLLPELIQYVYDNEVVIHVNKPKKDLLFDTTETNKYINFLKTFPKLNYYSSRNQITRGFLNILDELVSCVMIGDAIIVGRSKKSDSDKTKYISLNKSIFNDILNSEFSKNIGCKIINSFEVILDPKNIVGFINSLSIKIRHTFDTGLKLSSDSNNQEPFLYTYNNNVFVYYRILIRFIYQDTHYSVFYTKDSKYGIYPPIYSKHDKSVQNVVVEVISIPIYVGNKAWVIKPGYYTHYLENKLSYYDKYTPVKIKSNGYAGIVLKSTSRTFRSMVYDIFVGYRELDHGCEYEKYLRYNKLDDKDKPSLRSTYNKKTVDSYYKNEVKEYKPFYSSRKVVSIDAGVNLEEYKYTEKESRPFGIIIKNIPHNDLELNLESEFTNILKKKGKRNEKSTFQDDQIVHLDKLNEYFNFDITEYYYRPFHFPSFLREVGAPVYTENINMITMLDTKMDKNVVLPAMAIPRTMIQLSENEYLPYYVPLNLKDYNFYHGSIFLEQPLINSKNIIPERKQIERVYKLGEEPDKTRRDWRDMYNNFRRSFLKISRKLSRDIYLTHNYVDSDVFKLIAKNWRLILEKNTDYDFNTDKRKDGTDLFCPSYTTIKDFENGIFRVRLNKNKQICDKRSYYIGEYDKVNNLLRGDGILKCNNNIFYGTFKGTRDEKTTFNGILYDTKLGMLYLVVNEDFNIILGKNEKNWRENIDIKMKKTDKNIEYKGMLVTHKEYISQDDFVEFQRIIVKYLNSHSNTFKKIREIILSKNDPSELPSDEIRLIQEMITNLEKLKGYYKNLKEVEVEEEGEGEVEGDVLIVTKNDTDGEKLMFNYILFLRLFEKPILKGSYYIKFHLNRFYTEIYNEMDQEHTPYKLKSKNAEKVKVAQRYKPLFDYFYHPLRYVYNRLKKDLSSFNQAYHKIKNISQQNYCVLNAILYDIIAKMTISNKSDEINVELFKFILETISSFDGENSVEIQKLIYTVIFSIVFCTSREEDNLLLYINNLHVKSPGSQFNIDYSESHISPYINKLAKGYVNKESTKKQILEKLEIRNNNRKIAEKLFAIASKEFNTEDKVSFVRELVEAVFSATDVFAEREKYLCKLFFEDKKEEISRLKETIEFARKNRNNLILSNNSMFIGGRAIVSWLKIDDIDNFGKIASLHFEDYKYIIEYDDKLDKLPYEKYRQKIQKLSDEDLVKFDENKNKFVLNPGDIFDTLNKTIKTQTGGFRQLGGNHQDLIPADNTEADLLLMMLELGTKKAPVRYISKYKFLKEYFYDKGNEKMEYSPYINDFAYQRTSWTVKGNIRDSKMEIFNKFKESFFNVHKVKIRKSISENKEKFDKIIANIEKFKL